jgi:hypothetical protein
MRTERWCAWFSVGSYNYWYSSKLRDSVIGPNTSTLDDFIISIINRFTTSRVSPGHSFVIHVALLVRILFMALSIILELTYTALICFGAPASFRPSGWRWQRINDDNEQADSASRAITQPDCQEAEDVSCPPSSMSSVSQCSKKHRRGNGLMLVPQPKGSDFWLMVENWFSARMQPDQYGPSLTMPGWKKYMHFK